MRIVHSMFAVGMTALLGSASSFAQAPATQAPSPLLTRLFSSSQDVAALIDKAKRDARPGQATVLEPLLHLAPYTAYLEYRTATVGPAAIHAHEDEFFYMLEGSATVITGGKLVHSKPLNAGNLTGDSIEGGKAMRVSKGDVFVVPQNTPHWFSKVDGHVIDISLHVPGSAAQ